MSKAARIIINPLILTLKKPSYQASPIILPNSASLPYLLPSFSPFAMPGGASSTPPLFLLSSASMPSCLHHHIPQQNPVIFKLMIQSIQLSSSLWILYRQHGNHYLLHQKTPSSTSSTATHLFYQENSQSNLSQSLTILSLWLAPPTNLSLHFLVR